MTPDTAALRALLDAATPRPWKVILPGDLGWGERRKYRCIEFERRTGYTTSPIEPQDAALIVAAVNALPGLLDRIEAMEAVGEHAGLVSDWPRLDWKEEPHA